MSGQSQNRPTATEILADRLAGPVTAADREKAALCVLDWAGCAVAGAASPAAAAMRAGLAGAGEGAGRKTDPLTDVLYWGALGNVLEMDDVDKRALLHPGPVVVPAALAAAADTAAGSADDASADDAGADGRRFLNGVVRGYEAVIRIGRAVGPDHYRFWHNTGTCGPFGAAAAAASIFDLDTEKTVWALGLAGTQASGFWQTRHEPASQAKQLHTARAAHSGLMAARLAANGFVGVKAILEGPQGFFAATCGDADPMAVVDFDRAGWAVHDVSVKPWPACRHAHAAIDAALALRAGGVDAGDVERAVIRTYGDALVFCDKPSPEDVLSAKFSLQHSVAVSLLNGPPRLDDFEGPALADPAIRALRGKIAAAEDETYSRRYPARFGAALDIVLVGGGRRTVEIPDALGDPENPPPRDLVLDKARMLMAHGGLDTDKMENLISCALSLPEPDGSLKAFLQMLKSGALQ